MDIRIGVSNLIDSWTLSGCLCGTHPWSIANLDSMITFFIMCTWRVDYLLGGRFTLEEEHWASWRKALSPRWHGDTWLLAWRLVLDLRMLGLRSYHVGGVKSEVHMS